MADQTPHLEVFSRNRVSNSRITILVTIIPALGVTGFAIVALWPYRYIIAYILLVLVAFGAYYLVARGMIDLRKKSVEANTIHLGEHGIVDASSGRVLPEKQPLLLEPPAQGKDEPLVSYSYSDVAILAAISAGKTQQEAADMYHTNQPYVSRLVKKWKDQQNMV